MQTTNTLTVSDVLGNIMEGLYDTVGGELKKPYDENWVFDEDKSVKWNREKVVSENKKIEEHNEMVKENKYTGVNGFAKDLQEAISTELGINMAQSYAIYRYAWEEGHSSGFNEVVNVAMDMIDLFQQVKESGDK